MKKIILTIFIFIFCFSLFGCGKKDENIIKDGDTFKTKIGSEEFGTYMVEGIFADSSTDDNSMIYTNAEGTMINIKCFDKLFSNKDIMYTIELTKKLLSSKNKKNMIVSSTFDELGYSFVEGTLIRGAVTDLDNKEYNVDVYLIFKDNKTYYLSLEGYKDEYDISKQFKVIMDYYLAFS